MTNFKIQQVPIPKKWGTVEVEDGTLTVRGYDYPDAAKIRTDMLVLKLKTILETNGSTLKTGMNIPWSAFGH